MSRMLLVRAGDGVWCVPENGVSAIERSEGGVRIELRGPGPVDVSDVLGRVETPVRPLGRMASRLLPAGIVGFAALGERAVAVIDPSRPPWLGGRKDGSARRKGGRE